MAKRTVKQVSLQEPTELIKSKSVFKKELEERIKKGEIILGYRINTVEDFNQLKSDYSSWHDYNLELLKQSFNKVHNEYRDDYDKIAEWSGLSLGGRRNPAEQFQAFTEKFTAKIDSLKKLVQKLPLLKATVDDNVPTVKTENDVNMSQVFIVHGHDDLAKIETARFIEKLGFKPIILHEQANSGQTIIEKIESYSNVGFGVVLYTACDVGAKKGEEANLKSRARQNVVFEHGYLIGKIGRKNVSALVKGNVETPNDISGVVYISMDSDWKLDLAKELRKSGYPVDMNKII
jgi:predicted nucleotide-binding protein